MEADGIEMEPLMIVNDKEIKGFFSEYRWLSNFYPCDITYEGQKYLSTEAAYQAAKTIIPAERKLFIKLTPSKAKRKGQKITLRSDWEQVKEQVMYDVLKLKFKDEVLAKLLKETGTKYLEETNWWGDEVWGVCNGVGQNKLGKLLMKVREEL